MKTNMRFLDAGIPNREGFPFWEWRQTPCREGQVHTLGCAANGSFAEKQDGQTDTRVRGLEHVQSDMRAKELQAALRGVQDVGCAKDRATSLTVNYIGKKRTSRAAKGPETCVTSQRFVRRKNYFCKIN